MSEQVRVGVLGAAGRMGASVCEAVDADPSLVLVAAFDPHGAGAKTAQGLEIHSGLNAFLAERPEVVVDFTIAEAARQNLPVVAAAGRACGGRHDRIHRRRYVGVRAPHFTSSNC